MLLTRRKARLQSLAKSLLVSTGVVIRGWGEPMFKTALITTYIAALLAYLSASSLSAQVLTGDVNGTVTDASGAVIAGADVSAVCPETGQTRDITTGTAGEYHLTEMPKCNYKVSV